MPDHNNPIATDSFSRADIDAFVADWYHQLDVHAPAEQLASLVADQVEMQFPEGWCVGSRHSAPWYEGVIRIFFDELHIVTHVGFSWRDDRYLLDVVVNWQARRWNPPAPRSEWIGFDAYQRWELIRAPGNDGRLAIARYIVDELRPMPGSKPL
ncbi:MAG: nuclear transport factor 2 family protein [Planctomycetes bacterium]|nr:nuclear transport factor 2 family protein [Planctomycetota bacterium]